MASYGPMSTVVCDIGWYNAPEAVVGVSIVTRRSTCTTRSGSTAFPAGAPTCRERRLDGTRESRMRAICMSGLMSGDWKRTYGANCDTGVSESGRKQSSLATYGHRASRRLYPLWNQHPEPTGSRRATPPRLFQHRAGQFLLKPRTLFRFHEALKKCKYRWLFSSGGHRRPGPQGPSKELIDAIVEIK